MKILPGVRRCGKSTIFEMPVEELRNRGIPDDHIIQNRYTEMDQPQDLFDRVVKYIIENMGKTFSASSIAKFLKNEHRNRKILDGVLENLW